VSSPANAAYSADELSHQLKSSGSTVLFTCLPLLSVALEAAANSGIPKNRIYLIELPKAFTGQSAPKEYKTLEQLIQDGKKRGPLESLRWTKGQGKRQTAFLCYSSGTSGLPVCNCFQGDALSLTKHRKELRSRIET
jgi:acyl-CoA synthetase (AMP-forming)/AMP-acid ligase II